MELKIVARIESPFPSKFGIPRQSGLIPEIESRIIFEPECRNPDAIRGIDGFSHLWLIWAFSESIREEWSPTVRPPRLGGNMRMGVFATRSPFRPNPLGLSCVRLVAVEKDASHGSVLRISGADLMDGTPIFDIKPYLPLADCVPDAVGGFSEAVSGDRLTVSDPKGLMQAMSPEVSASLTALLSQDPRPAYHKMQDRIYSFEFSGYHISFFVRNGCAILSQAESLSKEK